MPDSNLIHCPHCGQGYFVQPHQWTLYQGQAINCTRCGKPFTVSPPPSAVAPGAAGPGNVETGGTSSSPEQVGGGMPPWPQGQQVAPQPPGAPQGYVAPQGYPGVYPSPYSQYAPTIYPPPPTRTSGLAIASLVLGVLSFCLPALGSIAAVGTGIGGLLSTRERRLGGRGLAIAGLALGLFTLVIESPLLLMVSLPAASRGLEEAHRLQCADNVKSLGVSLMTYAETHDNKYPAELDDLLDLPSPPKVTAFVCPSDSKSAPASSPRDSTAADISSGLHCSYVYLGSGVKSTSDGQIVILYEPLGNHRHDGMNVLFADGHSQWLTADEAQSILDQRARGARPIKLDAQTP